MSVSTPALLQGHTTSKVLVACAPSGAAVFVSEAFEGSISDKEICEKSGFFNIIEKNDMILADRGFLIEEELRQRGAYLNIPPFMRGKKALSLKETIQTKCIAKARIHIGLVFLNSFVAFYYFASYFVLILYFKKTRHYGYCALRSGFPTFHQLSMIPIVYQKEMRI